MMVSITTLATVPINPLFRPYRIHRRSTVCRSDTTCCWRRAISGPSITSFSSRRCHLWFSYKVWVKVTVKTDTGTTMPSLRATKPIQLAFTSTTTCSRFRDTINITRTTTWLASLNFGDCSLTVSLSTCSGELRMERVLKIFGIICFCREFTSSTCGCQSLGSKSRRASSWDELRPINLVN